MIRAARPAIDTSDAPFAVPPDVVLDLPAPPSVNKTRRIDWRYGKKMKAWTQSADALVLAAKCRSWNPVKLARYPSFELHVVLSESHTKIDIDNGLKWLIDYLRRIQLIEDDGPKHMRRLVVEFGLAPQGCRVTVRPLGPARVGAYGVAG